MHQNPEISQRELAEKLGISLGKVNYCLKSVIQKGWVKVNNFRNSQNKTAYSYILTPGGIELKARLTIDYIRIKMQEYEDIKKELEELVEDAKNQQIEIDELIEFESV